MESRDSLLTKNLAFVLILLVASAELSPVRAEGADPSRMRPAGLFFSGSYWPGALFLSREAGFAGDIGAGVGYDLNCGIAPWVAFLTGRHRVPDGSSVNYLSYGGFVLGVNVHFRPHAPVHPLLTVAFRTGTLLDEGGVGENQEGFRIAAGESFAFSRYFVLSAQMMYGRDYHTRWIGEPQSPSAGAPRSAAFAGLMFMFDFYPQLYP